MSKADDRNDLSRNVLEQMSTADLEELLFRDFYAVENEKSDLGGLYQAAQILAARKGHTGFGADRSWERFWEKYRTLAGDRDHPAEGGGTPPSDAALGRRHCRCRRWLHGAFAAAALAVLLLSISATATAKDVWNGIRTWWTDEVMTIAPGQIVRAEQDEFTFPEEPKDYADIQEALNDYGFSRSVVPSWVPEGFAAMDVVVDDHTNADIVTFCAAYVRDEDWIILGINIYLVRQDGENGSYAHFQKDEGDPVSYPSGGVTHMLATNAGRPVALWTNGPAECCITGDITMEELKQMIDSIY